MNIRPSAAIRQNYNEIAELCRKTAEPDVYKRQVRGASHIAHVGQVCI